MRVGIVLGLAAMALAATAAEGQPARHPATSPAPRPPKCAYGSRLVQQGACTSPRPWRCELCPTGVRILRITDKCGAPIEFCRRPRPS
ncbi:MAG TPA: hypothetical protein VN694_03455 [Caulobacteraceae bacterium]|nr:hypothetical protein [Caulobacteraceae bacterium]